MTPTATSWHERLCIAAGWLVFAWFVTLTLLSVRFTPFGFDSALHAEVAKNIARGAGWSISYPGEGLLAFTTTGPVVVLAGAALVKLLGNPIWAPALANALLNVLLLGLLLQRLRQYGTTTATWLAMTLGLCFGFAYYSHEWWSYFLGEIPSFLLLLLACAVAMEPNLGDRKRYVLLGLLIALSMLARMLTLPGFAGLGCCLLAKEWSRLRQQPAALLRDAAWGTVSLALPLLAFQAWLAWHFPATGTPTYADYLQFRKVIYANNSAMGIGQVLSASEPLELVRNNARQNAAMLAGILRGLGIPVAAALGTAVLALGLLCLRLSRPRQAIDYLAITLALVLFFYAVWFFAFAMIAGFERYALHPILAAMVLLVLLIARQFSWPGILLLAFVTVLAAPPLKTAMFKHLVFMQEIKRADPVMNQLNREALEAAEYLRTHSFRYPLANCGWLGATRELEYLLPGSGHFQDCYRLIEDALEPDPANPQGSFRWKHPVDFTLVLQQGTWTLSESFNPDRLRHQALMQACAHNTLYQTRLYRVMECRAADLQQAVALDRDTPFVGTPPIWQQHTVPCPTCTPAARAH